MYLPFMLAASIAFCGQAYSQDIEGIYYTKDGDGNNLSIDDDTMTAKFQAVNEDSQVWNITSISSDHVDIMYTYLGTYLNCGINSGCKLEEESQPFVVRQTSDHTNEIQDDSGNHLAEMADMSVELISNTKDAKNIRFLLEMTYCKSSISYMD